MTYRSRKQPDTPLHGRLARNGDNAEFLLSQLPTA